MFNYYFINTKCGFLFKLFVWSINFYEHITWDQGWNIEA